MSYLSINNIEVIYDHVILVLKGVSLQVPQGKIVALLGANGAGKSTTLKSISNLLRAERGDVTKGSVEFKGNRIDQLTPADLGRQHPVAETNPPATALQQSADFGIIPQTLHILREQVGRKLQNLARTRFAVPSQAHPVAQMEMRQPAA